MMGYWFSIAIRWRYVGLIAVAPLSLAACGDQFSPGVTSGDAGDAQAVDDGAGEASADDADTGASDGPDRDVATSADAPIEAHEGDAGDVGAPDVVTDTGPDGCVSTPGSWCDVAGSYTPCGETGLFTCGGVSCAGSAGCSSGQTCTIQTGFGADGGPMYATGTTVTCAP